MFHGEQNVSTDARASEKYFGENILDVKRFCLKYFAPEKYFGNKISDLGWCCPKCVGIRMGVSVVRVQHV